jgi:hypothetical protein
MISFGWRLQSTVMADITAPQRDDVPTISECKTEPLLDTRRFSLSTTSKNISFFLRQESQSLMNVESNAIHV